MSQENSAQQVWLFCCVHIGGFAPCEIGQLVLSANGESAAVIMLTKHVRYSHEHWAQSLRRKRTKVLVRTRALALVRTIIKRRKMRSRECALL